MEESWVSLIYKHARSELCWNLNSFQQSSNILRMRSRFCFSRSWVLSKGKLPRTSWVLQIATNFPNSTTPLFALQPGWWLLGLLESSYCFPVLPGLLHPRRSLTVPLAFLQHLEGCCSEPYERPGFLVEITLAPLPNPLLFKTVAMDSIKTQSAWT